MRAVMPSIRHMSTRDLSLTGASGGTAKMTSSISSARSSCWSLPISPSRRSPSMSPASPTDSQPTILCPQLCCPSRAFFKARTRSGLPTSRTRSTCGLRRVLERTKLVVAMRMATSPMNTIQA